MIVILSVAKAGTEHTIAHNGKNVELLYYKHIHIKTMKHKQLVSVHRRSKHEFHVCVRVCVYECAHTVRGFLVMNFCFNIRCCGLFLSVGLKFYIHFSVEKPVQEAT